MARGGGAGRHRHGQEHPVLNLQQAAGNRAVRDLVVVQRQPDPKSILPDPSQAAAKAYQPPAGKLSAATGLQSALFPHRRAMLEKFVGLYQSIELESLDPATKEQKLEKIVAEIKAEHAKLSGFEKKTTQDRKRITELEALLKRAETNAANRLKVAKDWRAKNASPGMTLEQLENEVTRLGTELGLPEFMTRAMIEFAGMRYGRPEAESGSKQATAHGSYYSPQRFLWALAKSRDPGIAKEAQAAYFKQSTPEALGRIKAMRDRRQVPDWVWQRLVYHTDLRLDPANIGEDWNKLPARPKGPDGKPALDTAVWGKAVDLWMSNEMVPGVTGNVVGATGWRNEMFNRAKAGMVGFSANVMLGVVCNELTEAIMADQGVQLPGGISANTSYFLGDLKDPAKRGAGRYFGRVDPVHLHAGAVLFRVDKRWAHGVAAHDEVVTAAGIEYPYPTQDPKYDDKHPAPPADANWTHLPQKAGERIRRETDTDPKLTHYARWQHQMTVADVRGDTVVVIETGDKGAGIYEHLASRLQADPYVFLGAKDERQFVTIPEVTVVGDPTGGPEPEPPK